MFDRRQILAQQIFDHLQLKHFCAGWLNAPTTDRVWEAIAKFAVDLVRWTTDSLSFKNAIFSENVRQEVQRMNAKLGRKAAYLQVYNEVGEKKKILKILLLLRKCGAHGDGPSHKQHWKEVERYAAGLPGKRFGTKKMQNRRLQLTETEGSELKLKMLHQLCIAIEKMQPSR